MYIYFVNYRQYVNIVIYYKTNSKYIGRKLTLKSVKIIETTKKDRFINEIENLVNQGYTVQGSNFTFIPSTSNNLYYALLIKED